MEAEDLHSQADIIPISLHGFFEKDCITQAEICRGLIEEAFNVGKVGRDSITSILENLRKQRPETSHSFIVNRIRLLRLHEYIQDLVGGGYITIDQARTMCVTDFLEDKVQVFLVTELKKVIDMDSEPDPASVSGKVFSIIADANRLAREIKAEKDAQRPQFLPRDAKLEPEPIPEPESKPEPKLKPKPKPKPEPKPKMKPKQKEHQLSEVLKKQCSSAVKEAKKFSTAIIFLSRGCSDDEDGDKMKQLATEAGGDLMPKLQEVKKVITSLIDRIENKVDISEDDIEDIERPEEEFDISQMQISTQCKRIKRSADTLIRDVNILRRKKITTVNAKAVSMEANLFAELQEVLGAIQCLEGLIEQARNLG